MTIARIATFAFAGIDALPVEVQVQIAAGLPAFLIVGPVLAGEPSMPSG